MSWSSYIDNMKAQGVQEGGIFSHNGDAWATSANFQPTAEEVKKIVGYIQAQKFDEIKLAGCKYMFINSDSGTLTCKCTKAPSDDKKYLVYCSLGKTFIMIGATAGAGERGQTKVVDNLKEYLGSVGY